ncbi:hypothetical protein H6F96_18770 [Microcoleus sp. FACHB-53]|nr:hypothetical protein [Microcoleus sp. FACHB-53]
MNFASFSFTFLSEVGYAGKNSINLPHQLQTDLSGYDFSHLTLWQADLPGVQLHQVKLAHSHLSKSVFDEVITITLSFE